MAGIFGVMFLKGRIIGLLVKNSAVEKEIQHIMFWRIDVVQRLKPHLLGENCGIAAEPAEKVPDEG